jgi:hypothetical protein
MKKLILVLSLVVMLIGTSCMTRNIRSITDHNTRPLTAIESADWYLSREIVRFFLSFAGAEAAAKYPTTLYRFWTCADTGEGLDCKVECDGTTDLDCIGW